MEKSFQLSLQRAYNRRETRHRLKLHGGTQPSQTLSLSARDIYLLNQSKRWAAKYVIGLKQKSYDDRL